MEEGSFHLFPAELCALWEHSQGLKWHRKQSTALWDGKLVTFLFLKFSREAPCLLPCCDEGHYGFSRRISPWHLLCCFISLPQNSHLLWFPACVGKYSLFVKEHLQNSRGHLQLPNAIFSSPPIVFFGPTLLWEHLSLQQSISKHRIMAGWRKGKWFQEKLLIPMHCLHKAFPGRAVTRHCLCHTCWIRAFRVGLDVFFALSGAHRSWVCQKSVFNAEYWAFKCSRASLSHCSASLSLRGDVLRVGRGHSNLWTCKPIFRCFFSADTNPIPTQHGSGCSQLVTTPQGEKAREGAVGKCFWEAECGVAWKARRLSEGWMQFPWLDVFPRRIYLVAAGVKHIELKLSTPVLPTSKEQHSQICLGCDASAPLAEGEPMSPFPWAFPSSQCLDWANLLVKRVGNHRSQLRGSTWKAEEEESCHRAI